MSFDYLTRKIKDARFEYEPFKHLYIREFFNASHFAELTKTPEVKLPVAESDEHLVEMLRALDYESIEFPGTTSSVQEYLQWHKTRGANTNQVTCEGIGIVFRLTKPRSPLLQDLNEYLASPEHVSCMAEKFGLDTSAVYPDLGLQKYLDGYEISPHPDIRKKALTYMVNVNPCDGSASMEYHTHYMEFVDSRRYVMEYWKGNPHADRCWVPWDWCRTVKQQRENNSFVMFSPADDTIHAIKASYDHLPTQRTQFYGNLWYNEDTTTLKPYFQDFEIKATPRQKNVAPQQVAPQPRSQPQPEAGFSLKKLFKRS